MILIAGSTICSDFTTEHRCLPAHGDGAPAPLPVPVNIRSATNRRHEEAVGDSELRQAGSRDTCVMRLARREDEDQGPTRVVIWSDGGDTDLGVIGVVLVATCICVAGIVVATNHDGIVGLIGVVVAVIGGLCGLVILVPLLVVVGIVGLVKRIT
jgi:hypothetical protein